MPVKKKPVTSDDVLDSEIDIEVEVKEPVLPQEPVVSESVEEVVETVPVVIEDREADMSEIQSKPILVAEEVPTTSEVSTAPLSSSEDTSRIFPTSNISRSDGGAPRWLLWLTVILVTLATVIVGAVLVMRKNSNFTATSAEQTEPTPTPEAQPSPTPALDRADLKVRVLNGSGITGLAADAKEYLEGLGYEGIAVGNASTSDYEVGEISIKDSKKNYLEMVRKDVEGKYTMAAESDAQDEESDYDVVIVLGKE